VTADELALRLEAGSVVVLDVRSFAEFSGETGYPCDPRQGHIPGAVHLDLEELFAADGRPLGRDELVAVLAALGVDPAADLVAYCHSGQRSAIAATVLYQAGFSAENYDGSWHEWSRREP
jgi:thiosulfate/3-mercaptopyruvate sulfurtransferase